MLENIKDRILHEDFNSKATFKEAFTEKVNELEDIKSEFDVLSYTDDELSNNQMEVNISEELENFEKILKDSIDKISEQMKGIR